MTSLPIGRLADTLRYRQLILTMVFAASKAAENFAPTYDTASRVTMATCKGRASCLKPKQICNTTPNPRRDPLAAGPELFEGQNNRSARRHGSDGRAIEAGMIAT